MLDTFVIGLREGLEASLIVSILVTYLVKTNRKADVPKVFIGLGLAILVALGVGLGLSFIDSELSGATEVILSGIFSLVAAAFVTWMIFWMSKQARGMGRELHAKVDTAATLWSLTAVAFFAVLREGVETALFIWATARTSPLQGALGAVLGLVAAAALGYLIYRGSVKIRLSTFFKYTGAFLILVAAGIFAYGIHELQEIGILPFLTEHTYDVTSLVPEDSLLHVILSGTIAFNPAPTLLETIAWFAFVIPVATLYIRQNRKK